jgi:hypothetical protein
LILGFGIKRSQSFSLGGTEKTRSEATSTNSFPAARNFLSIARADLSVSASVELMEWATINAKDDVARRLVIGSLLMSGISNVATLAQHRRAKQR